MTIVHLSPPRSNRAAPELGRWTVSLAVVVGLHLLGMLYVASVSFPLYVPPPPSDAVMIDLAPLPVAPPAPEPVVEEPPPPPPPPVVEPPPPPVAELPPPPVPIPEPEVVLPVKKPPPPRRPPPPRPVLQVQPQPVPAPTPAPVQAQPAPAPAAPRPAPADPLASYAARLLGELERHQRYPIPSRQRHEEGVVMLHFALDRGGHVSDLHVVKGSGHPLLDEEAQAMVRRSDPLPPPPPEIARDPLELTLPVRFALR